MNFACWTQRTHKVHKKLGSFPHGEDEVGEAPGSTQMKTALSEEKFKELKMKFLVRVQEVAHQHKVIPQLTINWDQTGLNIIPASTPTMEEQGSTRVLFVLLGVKRRFWWKSMFAVCMSQVFAEMCELMGIKKTRITALHPQSDGLVERINRTLESQLAKFVDQHHRDWDDNVPFLTMALRSATQKPINSNNASVGQRAVSTSVPLALRTELLLGERVILWRIEFLRKGRQTQTSCTFHFSHLEHDSCSRWEKWTSCKIH